jgi:hypothetical protein
VFASLGLVESKVWLPELIKYKGHHLIAPPKIGYNFLRSFDNTKGGIVELDFNVRPSGID